MIHTVSPSSAVQPLDLFAPAGTTLFRAGDRAASLLTLQAGLVKLAVVTPQGGEHILMFCGPGDVLSGAPLTAAQRYDAEAVALTDVRYSATAPEHPQVLEAFAAQLERSQANLALASAPVAIRLAATLLTLNERFGESACASYCRLDLPLRHEDYASAIHATRVAVSMAFAALRQTGTVLGQRGEYLLDTAQLRTLTQTWEL